MKKSTFEHALENNELDYYFKGLSDYFLLERDNGVHDYFTHIFIALDDIQCGKIEVDLFVREFTLFVKGLRNTQEDQEHFFKNIYFYLRVMYQTNTIDTDVLFNDAAAESAIRDYLHENKDGDLGSRFMSYIQRDFPQAKILTYLE
ncbi:hypothetical protein [Vibrio hepatarius]|uniref:hypothetical protein n=1 Tax=Vibrio hepatarius TaxID=171383 RepID=UPI001C087C33|nr:hypothetical protein [Vibrio hepatarius]MBU2898320.1 hypothetical protein [Vibrio hepatarius]